MPTTVSKAAGARRGRQVLERIHAQPPNIWYDGKQIADPAGYPPFHNGVESLAALYDLQWEQPQTLYESPTTGDQVSRTFLIPRTKDELKTITATM